MYIGHIKQSHSYFHTTRNTLWWEEACFTHSHWSKQRDYCPTLNYMVFFLILFPPSSPLNCTLLVPPAFPSPNPLSPVPWLLWASSSPLPFGLLYFLFSEKWGKPCNPLYELVLWLYVFLNCVSLNVTWDMNFMPVCSTVLCFKK